MNEQDIQKQIKQALAKAGEAVTTDELKQIVNTFISLMKELKIYLEKEMTDDKNEMSNMHKEMMSDIYNMDKIIQTKVSVSDMDMAIKSVIGDIDKIKLSISSMPDLSLYESKLEEIKASIPIIKETILDNPIQIRDKLESIKEEKEKLDILAIRDLRKELDELKKIRSTGKSYSLFGGGGSSSGGRTVQVYDLTSQLNGVLKTFTLPAFWRIISVHGSSFPFVFRPTIDYTVSGTTITFTSEIEASTTLATSQTLLVIYAE